MNLENEFDIERLRRKADQAWEMAGLARQDRDRADEVKRTSEAREYGKRISELLKAGVGK